MKVKLFTLFLFFAINAIPSFAVIDVKKNEKQVSVENQTKENLSKDKKTFRDWLGKKKMKKRKFKHALSLNAPC